MGQSLFLNFKTMGVVNATPNSFSDGGGLELAKSPAKLFRRCLKEFDIVDVGAESTAPFNSPVDAKTELERLEAFFFPLFDELRDPAAVISIDTYRPEVFYECALWFRRVWPKTSLIFNDISGQVDDDLAALLDENLPFDYIFSHNLSPGRDTGSGHGELASRLDGEDFVDSVSDYFCRSLSSLGKHKRKIILDPCFGFSKTRQQSRDLMSLFSRFESRLPPQSDVLVGISRKSFLRFPPELDPKLKANQAKLDALQAILAYELCRSSDRRIIFRTHAAYPFEAVKNAAAILRP